jgi:hypothetical protein
MAAFYKRWERKFWRFFVLPFVNYRFVRQPAVFESFISTSEKIFVITVAFNDLSLVQLQRKALKKFLLDPYDYFVVDNSNNDEKSEAIKKFCLENKINYARLGFNIGNQQRDAGTAHGMALNWAYRNVVLRFRPYAFGFWDYDLFPTKPVRVSDYLARSEAWGISIRLKPRLTPWHYPAYLWVGLLFFRTERFRGKMMNFLPDFGVDTGGRIPLDQKIMDAIPDLVDFYASPMIEIAPGVPVRKCGEFIHFENSSGAGAPSNALETKKQWMEKLIEAA